VEPQNSSFSGVVEFRTQTATKFQVVGLPTTLQAANYLILFDKVAVIYSGAVSCSPVRENHNKTWRGVETVPHRKVSNLTNYGRWQHYAGGISKRTSTAGHVWIMRHKCRFSVWRAMTCVSCVYNIPCSVPVSTRQPTLRIKKKYRYHAPRWRMCRKITTLLQGIKNWSY